jgi:DnaJ-domain-containing protein 1
MLDCFALLNEPRRPWLDAELLKQKFLALSAADHPDRVHGGTETERRAAQERYTRINSAYNCLRNDRDRVAHLLELERGAKPEHLQRIPPDLMDLSLEVSRLCREADTLLARKNALTSPLLRVQLFEPGQAATEQLQGLQSRINSWRDQLVDELKRLDARWTESGGPRPPERAEILERLEELYRLFSYGNRWISQIQERIAQLAI